MNVEGKLSAGLERVRLRRSPSLATAISLSLVIGVGAVLSVRSNVLLRHDRERVEHSFQVIQAADQVLIGLIDAETGQRGFLISADPKFLVPYEDAISTTIPHALHDLGELVSDRADQSARVRELGTLAGLKLDELSATLRAQREVGTEAARALLVNLQGKVVMDRIRVLTKTVQVQEQSLLAVRSTEVRRDEQRIIWTIVLVTTLSTGLRLALAAWRHKGSACAHANVD